MANEAKFTANVHPWNLDGTVEVLNDKGQSIATCVSKKRAEEIVTALNHKSAIRTAAEALVAAVEVCILEEHLYETYWQPELADLKAALATGKEKE